MINDNSSTISDVPHSINTLNHASSYYSALEKATYSPNQQQTNENNYPTLPTKENSNLQQTRASMRLDTENNKQLGQPAPPSSRIMGGVKSIIFRIIKFILSIFIILFNSVLLCYCTNYVFGKYLFVSQKIHFNLVNSTTLASSVYFNCTKQTKHRYHQCNQLFAAKYNIILFFEFGNRVHTSETDNIAIELKLYTKGGNVNNYEQLFYFEKLESIAETMNKILLSPLRLLGFFNNRKEQIELVELYDNYYEPIEKAEIVIKKTNLNIHYANISFKPLNGWIATLYSYIKFIMIIPMFCFFCIIQMAILVILRCTIRKVFKSKTKVS